MKSVKLPSANLVVIAGIGVLSLALLNNSTVKAIIAGGGSVAQKAKSIGKFIAGRINSFNTFLDKNIDGFSPGTIVSNSIIEDIRRRVVKPFGVAIQREAKKARIKPSIVAALIYRESKGRATSVGFNFDFGLMQITQAALTDVNKKFGTSFVLVEMKDSNKNIFVGTRFLKMMFDATGNTTEMLRAYNCGLSGAKRNGACGRAYALEIINTAIGIERIGLI